MGIEPGHATYIANRSLERLLGFEAAMARIGVDLKDATVEQLKSPHRHPSECIRISSHVR